MTGQNSLNITLVNICKLYQDIIKDSDGLLLLVKMTVDDTRPDTAGIIKNAIDISKAYQKHKLQEVNDLLAKLREEATINKMMDDAGIAKPTLH